MDYIVEKSRVVTIEVEKPIAYIEHKPTKSRLSVYIPIGWFKRFMLRFCFGIEYIKE